MFCHDSEINNRACTYFACQDDRHRDLRLNVQAQDTDRQNSKYQIIYMTINSKTESTIQGEGQTGEGQSVRMGKFREKCWLSEASR